MDAKPTLDISNLGYCAKHSREWKKRVKLVVHDNKKLRTKASRILSKWRVKQEELVGDNIEDPNPYQPSYVFYCLEVAHRE